MYIGQNLFFLPFKFHLNLYSHICIIYINSIRASKGNRLEMKSILRYKSFQHLDYGTLFIFVSRENWELHSFFFSMFKAYSKEVCIRILPTLNQFRHWSKQEAHNYINTWMTMQMKKQIFFVVREHHLIELEEMDYFRRPVLSHCKEN